MVYNRQRVRKSLATQPADRHAFNPIRLLFPLGGFVVGSLVALYMVNQLLNASVSHQTSPVTQSLNDVDAIPLIESAETASEFLNRVTVSVHRLAADASEVMIDGELHKVGDVVYAPLGLRFIGHDADGEYLLFQDQKGQVHLLLIGA